MRSDLIGARRVLVLRLDNVGDVVMLTPALRALRAGLPGASITLMASPAGAQVAPMLPWVDDVWPVETLWQDASARMPFDPAREARLIDEIRDRRFDAAFIFTSFSQSPHPAAYACYLAGVPIRIAESKEFAGAVLGHAVPPLPDETYQVDRNLHLVESAGIRAAGDHMELRIPHEASTRVDELLRGHGIGAGNSFVAVAPGASCAARRYDAARFGEAVRLLHEATSPPVVLLGSPRERALTSFVSDAAGGRATDLAGETSVTELAAIIERAAVVVANNSGAVHIATALGRPVVVLYSGTDCETQWAPPRATSIVLRRPTRCSPCYGFECPYQMECLDIPPQEVAAAAMRLVCAATVEVRPQPATV
jgi:ADP-heptose:LPS heptosyltransferase